MIARQQDADEAREDALDALAASVAPTAERDPKRVLMDTATTAPLTKSAFITLPSNHCARNAGVGR